MPISRITDFVASPAATRWLASADRPDRREHAREGEQHRHPGGHQRAERDDQDRQRHRQRRELGALEVLVHRLVQLVRRARHAELGDGERRDAASWTPLDRVEHRLDALVGLVLLAADLELHERGVAAPSRSGRRCPAPSGERTRATSGSPETDFATSPTAARNAGSSIVFAFDWTSTLSPARSGEPCALQDLLGLARCPRPTCRLP